jgi:hypothetical protein
VQYERAHSGYGYGRVPAFCDRTEGPARNGGQGVKAGYPDQVLTLPLLKRFGCDREAPGGFGVKGYATVPTARLRRLFRELRQKVNKLDRLGRHFTQQHCVDN